jgi:hypothetical protein
MNPKIRRLTDQVARHKLQLANIVSSGDMSETNISIAERHNIKVGPNIAVNLAAAQLVRSVVICEAVQCERTLVTYIEGYDSRHSRGLDMQALTAIVDTVGPEVISHSSCDHHGGKPVEMPVVRYNE